MSKLTTLFNRRLPNHGINQVDFKPLLEADPEVTSRLTQEEIDEIFNPTYYTKRVDEIFERIGLGD